MQIEELFTRAQELPSIPKVVQELIQSFDSGDFDIDDVTKKVGMDQVLTAKVLRLANSTKYGGQRKISSINEAVVRLGFNSLRTLVLASGFVSTFKAPPGFDLKGFWRESFGRAELARWLAPHVKQDAETAFTAGMLSNIGRLLVHMLMSEKAQEIDRVVAKGGNRQELQMSSWGFTSPDVGAKVANMWKFPEPIVVSIEHQWQPLEAEDSRLAGVLFLASYLHRALEAEQSDEDIVANFPGDIAKAIGADVSGILGNLEQCHDLDSGIDELLD